MTYNVIEEEKNYYIFTTDKNVEYQLVLKESGIKYKEEGGKIVEISELCLNCDINTAAKDYKTNKTLAKFYAKIAEAQEAIYIQIHNQPESLKDSKVCRRGLIRAKLWNRILTQNFDEYLYLNNMYLAPNPNSDIFSIIIKKESLYFKQIIKEFYRFCYDKMYKQ